MIQATYILHCDTHKCGNIIEGIISIGTARIRSKAQAKGWTNRLKGNGTIVDFCPEHKEN